MDKLEEALEELAKIEEKYDVRFTAVGGAYGSARLVVCDEKSNEELARG